MTTFQEPQPQSRRAVRQSERGDSAEPPVGFTQFPPPAAVPPAPQYYANPEGQGDMWDTNARRAAQLPQAPPPEAAPPGRRAAAAAPPPAAEPLNYSTASRQPATPSYDPPSARSRLDARQPDLGAAAPQGERSTFRARDFSPEGRRAAQAAERAAAAPAWSAPAPASDLDYQTEVREGFGTPTSPAPAAAPISQVPPQFAAQPTQPPVAQGYPQPVAPGYPASQPTASYQAPAPMADAPGEQTLSRRELRAILAQEEAARGGQVAFDQPAQPAQNAPLDWPPPAPAAPAAAAYPSAPPAQPLAQPQGQQPGAQQPWDAAPMSAPPAPSTNTGMTNALAEFDTLARAQEVPSSSAGWTPPVGHWSTQADLDDEIETTISRRIGSGSSATNALVLPDIPLGTDIRGPLTSTGEVMLTGSIDLPHSLGSTGTSDRIDHDGIDGLFDLHDREVISTDSQPVRAIRAVSTHQTGHGVTHTQKPKGTRALTALLISASFLAVIVAGLLIAAFAFNIF